MYDALLGTWYDKYHFMRPRPAHLEPTLPIVILTPKHPSYPAGHGTFTAAGVSVLRAFFPEDESEYGGIVEEVNNARVWAGVHFRSDMTAGNEVGDHVAGRSSRLSIWTELPVRIPTIGREELIG